MIQFFSDMKVGTKILVISLFLAIIPTLLLGLISYSSSVNVINEQIETLLETQVQDMKGWTNDVYKLTRNKVNSDLNVLRQNFYAKGTPEIINNNMTLIDKNGKEFVVNDNFEIVDGVRDLVGGAATVFQVYNNTYAVRISTNVKGTDGERAVGTHLTDNVYEVAVKQGETYYGRRDLFGVNYVTAYEPIRDRNGTVIGVLFVGTEEEQTLDVVKKSIRDTVVGKNGYMYVLDGNGMVLVHPTLDNVNWSDMEYVKEMMEKKEGAIIHQVNGTTILDAYTYFEPLDWYIVSRAEMSDFDGPINTIRNTILAIVIASIVIGAVIAILFGQSIAGPLQQVVVMIKELRNGHLSARLNIRRKDEIGIMATTMDEFADDLQKNVVGNIVKIANGEYIQEFTGPVDELDQIRPSLQLLVESFDHLHKETIKLTDAARAGDLSIRGDEKAFRGGYRRIIAGFNKTLETITEPVNEAMRLAGCYASGDFTARFDEKIPVAGEFVAYRDALNTIGIELSRLMKLITEELFEGVSVLSVASSEILTVTSQLSSASSQTANTVNETSDTVETVRKKTDLVNLKTKSMSEKAMKAIEVSETGQQSVQEILDGMNHIQRQMDMISMNVVKLSEQSQAIGEIIATVTDISEQSNLLAVNASIEAAKAGDFGKGFAVVAHEIHNLAQQSKQATGTIRTILTDIQRGVSSTVVSAERGSNTVADAVRLTTDARKAIEVLTRSIADSSHEAIEITASIQDQVAGMDQISEAIENIRNAAQKNLEITHKAEKTAEDLHELGIRLKKITLQYQV
ncbi:methyl-accepting chemotaxis sensory transducer [Methanospirillum hungatei JF-1]|jgi:methyl-accepting chemotaxis protein|uniref:Methyl-accepting chemotaxis sensory transducer n=1 Tax=Methanospirillum hungatei JF-1 (strain ATCC 27890 / DSM 864 / NBRC 100397 / JF-1) TaxID=323259 RepID=Q2FQ15_METHJ|nr:Cache 3/Cache 2 fusion domain-containing protein [Methanospirillum hungatei]ABD40257.1 methyl-accepting chemotaxis sensory transducer [Methanospirillum hungatei JF-1]